MIQLLKVREKFKINKFFIVIYILSIITGQFKQISILFIFVTLHELSHAIVAYKIGLKIRSIELFPFGGIARIDNIDSAGTFKEIIVSIAGPLFNFTTAIFLFFLSKINIMIPDMDYIININITLGLFNLLPGFPLDGGRILRASFNYLVGFKKATKIAIVSGKVISVILIICGVILWIYARFNLSFFVIPFFMFISAGHEEKVLMFIIIKSILNKKSQLKNKGVMETTHICAFQNTNVSEILKFFDLNKYHIIAVINNEMEVEAFLTESQIFENLSAEGEDGTLGQLSKRINREKPNKA